MREIRTSGSMRGRPVMLFGIAGRSTLLKPQNFPTSRFAPSKPQSVSHSPSTASILGSFFQIRLSVISLQSKVVISRSEPTPTAFHTRAALRSRGVVVCLQLSMERADTDCPARAGGSDRGAGIARAKPSGRLTQRDGSGREQTDVWVELYVRPRNVVGRLCGSSDVRTGRIRT